jgi:polar amino acid transport system substrate-binding protein
LRKALALLLLVALLGVTAACGSDDDEAAPATTAPATEATDTEAEATTEEEPDPCAKEELVTVVDGSLTIATDNPAFPPWFQDEEGAPWDPTTPATGLGYEAAVA